MYNQSLSPNRKVITRKTAKQMRMTRYWDGKGCKYGHNEDRYTSSGICCECNKMHNEKHRNKPVDGMITVKVRIHPDDVPGLKLYVESAHIERRRTDIMNTPGPAPSIKAPPPPVPSAASQIPPPPPMPGASS